MSRQGRGQHLPSKSIDRLSIIPKFEKSFVEDAEDSDDFEVSVWLYFIHMIASGERLTKQNLYQLNLY